MLPIEFFNADINQLQIADEAIVQQAFQFIIQESKIEFNYPQGGCQQRAQIMSLMISKKFNLNHYKVWLFAPVTMHVHDERTLYIDDKNKITSNNIVEWNYHVAPVVRMNENNMAKTFVLDPSIDNTKPILLENWFAAIGNSDASEYTFTFPSNYFFNGCLDNNGKLTPLFDGSFFECDDDTLNDLIVEKGLALNDMVMKMYYEQLKSMLESETESEATKADIKSIFGNATVINALFAENLSGSTNNTTQRYTINNYSSLLNKARQIFYDQLAYWSKVTSDLI